MSQTASPDESNRWTPEDWRSLPTTQQPRYPDADALSAVTATLRGLPPLVTSWEIERLRAQIADAAAGPPVPPPGGDCASGSTNARRIRSRPG